MRLPLTLAVRRPQSWIRVGAADSKVSPTFPEFRSATMRPSYSEEKPMRKVINCECGEAVRGNSDEELIAAVRTHISQHHPDLVGKLSEQDILSMSEEDD